MHLFASIKEFWAMAEEANKQGSECEAIREKREAGWREARKKPTTLSSR